MSNNALPKKDPLAFTFLIAMALAAAVVTGASLSGIATGAVQDLLRTAGVGQDSRNRAEQHRQALALEKIELLVSRARADIALLNARLEDAENLRQQVVSTGPSLESDFELAALRSSLEENAERNRSEFTAVNKRIDWLEKLVYSQDATNAVQPATPAPRQGAQSKPRWFVRHAEKGVAVIAGRGGAIDVTPGLVVPNLGRVAAIRQEGGRWVVVMDKGVTIRGR